MQTWRIKQYRDGRTIATISDGDRRIDLNVASWEYQNGRLTIEHYQDRDCHYRFYGTRLRINLTESGDDFTLESVVQSSKQTLFGVSKILLTIVASLANRYGLFDDELLSEAFFIVFDPDVVNVLPGYSVSVVDRELCRARSRVHNPSDDTQEIAYGVTSRSMAIRYGYHVLRSGFENNPVSDANIRDRSPFAKFPNQDCKFFDHNPHLPCAVNPNGCDVCSDYCEGDDR